MAIPIIIITASWILILAVIAGLCLSARRGDLQQLSTAPEEPQALSPVHQPARRTSLFWSLPAGLRRELSPLFDVEGK